MEEKSTYIEPLLKKAQEIATVSIDLIEMKFLENMVEVSSTLFSRGLFMISILMALFIASLGLSLWIGTFLGESYFGFLIVAGFYCLIGLIFYFGTHKMVKKTVGDSIVSKMTDLTP